MTNYDVVIIGGGAAGLMCAIEAGKRGRHVLLLEKSDVIAGKIRISGGGRCNFTNLYCGPDNFLSQNPRFCVSALRRFPPKAFIALMEQHNIAYHEKKLGQLFCDGKSQQIIDMLQAQCEAAGVEIRTGSVVEELDKRDKGFQVQVGSSDIITCKSLVIASGGKSIPKMGASGFGYQVAEKFGHKVIDPEPALVPFTFQNDLLEKLKSLAGVSVEAEVSFGKKSFSEAVLFTHRGLSGPAILQISSYWQLGQEIRINMAPGEDIYSYFKQQRDQNPKQDIHNILSQKYARRLAQFICDEADVRGRLADLSNRKLETVARQITDWRLLPSGTEGFRTAEVTRGGVDTTEISSKTFESDIVSGLYFIGEVLDVTGHLGGHNFQWAWASGHAAGQYV